MPEMTENETPTKKQHRKKNRETHNAVERHRKKKINAGINRIGELIPCSPALKQSKNMILDQAFKYITELKRQNDELLLNGGNNEQAEEIKKLRKQLEEIQKENGRYIELLKANDICLYDDPTIHWKGNLKNSKVSVVIPSDQIQKNIIVYSNGSQPGGNSQGAAVQGITFNVGHNLQKQTANVVPVQRACNLVTPVSVSGVCPSENKPWHQTRVSAVAANQPLPLCLPATISAQNILELSTSESESSVLGATSGSLIAVPVGPEPHQHCSFHTSLNDQSSPENKNGQESPKLLKNTVPCALNVRSASSATTTEVLPSSQPCLSAQACRVELPGTLVAVTTAVCSQPPRPAGASSPVGISQGTDLTNSATVVSLPVPGVGKTATPVSTLSANPLDSGWTLSCSLPSSSVSTSDLKNINSLTRISSAGNTQTTWTTLQLAGNTIQPLSQAPAVAVAPVLNESVPSPTTTNHSRHVAAGINSSNAFPADGQAGEQVVVTLPSCSSLPMQPLTAQPQVKPQPPKTILPLNSAMQVIQMAQPVGSAVNAAPGNPNVIILQPPSTAPCPTVMRAEVPSQTVGQQIVIIQTANQNPVPLLSAPPPGSVRLPVNGVNAIIGSNHSMQNASTPQTFGGKHLVHILPRPSSLSTSSSTPTFSVAMSNQQQPQTISLNGQLFALQPVMSSSGATNQTPMQIIQPTTSEDPNTNVALNTFGALASLNQSISQMAGQSCVQLSISQPANLQTAANSQATSANCVSLTTAVAPPVTADNSATLPSACDLATTPSVNSVACLPPNVKLKRLNKKPVAKKHLAASKSACSLNPVREVGKLGCPSTEGSAELSCDDVLLDSLPVDLPSVAVSQANSVNACGSHSLEVLNSESVPKCKSTEESNSPSQEPVTSEHFATAPAKSKDSTPVLQPEISQDKPPTSLAFSDAAKSCPSANVLIPSPSDPQVLVSQVSGLSSTTNTASPDCVSEVEIVAEPCRIEQDPSDTMQTTGLLKGQGLTALLSDLAKEKDAQKTSLSVQADHPDFPENSKLADSSVDFHPKQELLLLNGDGGDLPQHHSCIPGQEVVSGSLLAGRQADSPMSTSSGSSRSFSVASMLPEAAREDVTSSAPASTCDSCTFVEQTDIVALAARAIFDQENLEKGRVGIQADIREGTSKPSDTASLEGDQPFKSQIPKENGTGQAEAVPNEFNSQDSVEAAVDRPLEKPSCSVGIKTSNASLQVSASQPPSITSLSVNNLIHQSGISHPLVSCAGLSQSSEQTAVPATVNLTVASSSYGSQPPGPSLMTEYAQGQLNTMTSTLPNSQIQEPLLKPSHESRKDSAKRAVQDDLLLSSAKRQKHCQPAPLRLESMSLMSRTPDSISDQTQIMVSQIPPNSSNSIVPVSNPTHGDGLTRLFPPSNNFVAPALRQTELQCSSQPSVAEQQPTQASQHLQALQQHVPAQGVSHLHSNHLYLKQQQQQQVGQLRERHHLYQLQHHAPHAESTGHPQPHSVHQQRTLQQEVQMQKKRNLVQGTQASQLSLQPKHHGTDQSRPKSGQPHPHHQQMQQQMQQQFGNSQPEKSCDNPSTSRNHHNHPQNHLNQDIMHQQQDVGSRQQGSGVSSEHVPGHNPMQRLLTSRGLEQQMVSQPSIVTRPSDMTCTPHRPERNRVSSYSAEALIGKTSSNSEQRMALSIQGSRVSDQLEMRNYLDIPRNKNLAIHNMQSRVDHTLAPDIRLPDCQTFKPSGASQQPQSNFEVQSSRNNEIGNPVSSLRSMQSQTFRISQNSGPPAIDRQKRLPYPPVQSIPTGDAVPPRDSDNTCHQSFMQSLLAPHLSDQVIGSQRSLSEHQRNTQCGPSSAIEYNCPPAHESVHIRRESESQNRESCDMPLNAINTRNSTLNIPFSSSSSSGDIQGRNTSPNVSVQKSNPMRITDSHGTKGHMNSPVTTNMHGIARPALPHPSVSHGSADQGPPVRQTNSSVPQRSRHPAQDSSSSKIRQPERNRSGNQRHSNVFDPGLPHLPLSTSGSMILGRQQPTSEKRGSIVRFMPDSPQVPNDNSAPDQHTLSQNFGFSFIPEGGMNPPINANTSFIPQVTQPSATRAPALIPVDPQNTLPSFYPPYSPAHPPLSNDISIPYFSNQMFSNPSTEKVNSGSLNNRFGSILSPPRPVGFAQPSFPLLPDMPPMHMTNSHLSNFNMTSLFPEIATALPDGSAMSPLLTIANSSASDSSKQPSNRPAHNISHILGHDCSSAV
uniref:Upstream transcription factor family member 3 n=1 Tax=Loxodonta africana TaxID=9785 RepID=G3T3R8_LOXAF|nr:basic helix-loop-helix domain-containing protein USF3 isoform X1 [Loxodonta africana]XP_010591248.1 basic helix-loop-helix domain-containing protein USF3 isoform X1 [Loxodonta africana]XP_010591249.1 basic helix-loop-helix domain-containing protein USF3 isoform X1 [Loxodonta africana]XP_023407555.1 basic helix-loop-helix domain-containing protein USF3 isoform X1 [Loxodonta africana]XP_023407557.1 basic helix-loop-helix domain-containing protein USF3 isoform X1 [Loxodonta africana]XP_0234075